MTTRPLIEPTRGERNHNPGNLRDFGIPWLGLASPPHDDAGFCVFVDDAHGLRALALDLLNMQRRHGLRTVDDIIGRFAPIADHNLTPAYIAAVALQLGCSPSHPLDLCDPATLRDFVVAVVIHENGRCIYTPQQVADAVAALG